MNIITIIVLSLVLYHTLIQYVCDYCRILYAAQNITTPLNQFTHTQMVKNDGA